MISIDWTCIRCGQDSRKVGKHQETGLCSTCWRHDKGWDIPCFIIRLDPDQPDQTWCIQHGVAADMTHHFDIHPEANND